MPVSILMVVDLPAPFAPDVAHHLARFDGEADAINGVHGDVLAHEKVLQRAADAFAAAEGAEILAQVVHINDGWHGESAPGPNPGRAIRHSTLIALPPGSADIGSCKTVRAQGTFLLQCASKLFQSCGLYAESFNEGHLL